MGTEDILAGIRRIEERWQEERERWAERDVALREFLDGLTERHVRVTQAMIGALGDLHVGIGGLQGEIRDLRAEIADQRQQIQANTQALLRLLDERFGPKPPQG